MSTQILGTKLYIPPPRLSVVHRPRLIERLNAGLHRKLTLVAAPAGFGKTTLVSAWVANCDSQVAWLSLDESDNDPARFLTYFVASLQTIAAGIGEGLLAALRSPQPPPAEAILTDLLNEIATDIQHRFLLVLDDYHVVDSKPVDDALTFLLEHMPQQMQLVIATREDPRLPLARLRARDQLTELRVTDLRFTASEAAGFLNQVMDLDLSAEDIDALETRTEGWIAGLQLAALSLQGHQDTSSFIQSFTGSSRFIIDYLAEEVLERQSDEVRAFLLRTSILERMCAPLCDAVLKGNLNRNSKVAPLPRSLPGSLQLISSELSSQAMLEHLEKSNLFIIPLDNERRWYRYHHLFADLLRQRLLQSTTMSAGDEQTHVAELHIRASQWYEDHGLGPDAFHHAVVANDVERAERLIEGGGMPQHLRVVVTSIVDWLESLPTTVLNARPWLWWRHGSLLLAIGQTTGVEEKLNAAEAALEGGEPDDKTRNLVGQIATARAVLALTRYQPGTIIAQSRRALEYLHPNNLSLRANANWTMGYAYMLQGDRAEARRAYTEAISLSQTAENVFTTILATSGLGQVQEAENQLSLAAETYRRVILLAGDQPLQVISGAYLGLARIFYQWNDLETAKQHGEQSLQLARQYGKVIDRFVVCEVFLARLKLAQGDVAGAVDILDRAGQSARQQNFVHRIPEVAAEQVLALLRQGDVAAAAHLAQTHELPLSQARVHLVQGNPSAALAVLAQLRRQAEAKGWADERLKVLVLEAVALHAHDERDQAVRLLGEALALAEPEGFIRIFVDEGPPMQALLRDAAKPGFPQPELAAGPRTGRDGITLNSLALPGTLYVHQLLAAFEETGSDEEAGKFEEAKGRAPSGQLLIEPLSERELEVLRLLGTELNGPEIAGELMVSLNTMRTHTRNIYNKLGVDNRRAAVRRAEELHLL